MVYLEPMSSSVTFSPSTMVNEPIPGKIRLFKISVPKAVAFIRHTFEFSKRFCPWSPHNLEMKIDLNIKRFFTVKSVTLIVCRIFYFYLFVPAILELEKTFENFSKDLFSNNWNKNIWQVTSGSDIIDKTGVVIVCNVV